MIQKITLSRVLPEVFHESRDEAFVKDSQIWLKDVTFDRHTNYLIEASSGAGKSSLCAFIYGSRHDYEGTIMMDGVDTRGFSVERWTELRTRSLAYLPQEMKLFPELTAMENILIKNNLTGFKSPSEIMELLGRLGIEEKADVKAGKMSVGQQQRVAIARALCQPFDFLIIDEPVSHLDETNNSVVASVIAGEAARQGASVIATSVGNTINIDDFKVLKL